MEIQRAADLARITSRTILRRRRRRRGDGDDYLNFRISLAKCNTNIDARGETAASFKFIRRHYALRAEIIRVRYNAAVGLAGLNVELPARRGVRYLHAGCKIIYLEGKISL